MMWPKTLIFYLVLLVDFIFSKEVGDSCPPTNTISSGICVRITDCKVAIRAVQRHKKHPYSRCGFENETEVICCPMQGAVQSKTTTPIPSQPSRTGIKPPRIADRECKKIVSSTIPPLTSHIISGEEASVGEFPHMVHLGFNTTEGIDFKCGGSLISKSFIITAAHCLENKDGFKPSFVRLGLVERGISAFDPATDIMISHSQVHPSYTVHEKYNDLALLRLERPAEISSNVNAICLYTGEDDPTTALTITGWGKIDTDRDIVSTVLLKANVTAVSREICGRSYTNFKSKMPNGVIEGQLCAQDSIKRSDACQGDSGGPLQALTSSDGHYRLVGVTSFGQGCASPTPGIYTRISHYLDWIESIVWSS